MVQPVYYSAYAQKSDTLITYSFGDNGTRAVRRATETYKLHKTDSTWVRTTFNANKVAVKTETFSDKQLNNLNGEYFEYDQGHVALKGFYLDNQKNGQWTKLDGDEKPEEVKTYQKDKLNGAYTTYWKDGTPKISGTYVDGKKVGEWKIMYENGNLALKESYDEKSKLTDSAYFDRNGKAVKKADVTTEPSFPGGMKQFYVYLSRNVRYPAEAHRYKIQGKVYLSFMISPTGKVEHVKVISSPDASLSQEAIKVTQQSPDWIPATLFGNPVSVGYSIDINFTLRQPVSKNKNIRYLH